jgi:hypothetical protein
LVSARTDAEWDRKPSIREQEPEFAKGSRDLNSTQVIGRLFEDYPEVQQDEPNGAQMSKEIDNKAIVGRWFTECTVLLAAAGCEPLHTAAVHRHAAENCDAAFAGWIARGGGSQSDCE